MFLVDCKYKHLNSRPRKTLKFEKKAIRKVKKTILDKNGDREYNAGSRLGAACPAISFYVSVILKRLTERNEGSRMVRLRDEEPDGSAAE